MKYGIILDNIGDNVVMTIVRILLRRAQSIKRNEHVSEFSYRRHVPSVSTEILIDAFIANFPLS